MKRKNMYIVVVFALFFICATPIITGLSLNDLDDVTINPLYDEQLLQYNSTTANWTNINYSVSGDGYAGSKGHPHNQDLNTTSAVTFTTVNTGQGANELYAMNQDVETTDDVTFSKIYIRNPSSNPSDLVIYPYTNQKGQIYFLDSSFLTRWTLWVDDSDASKRFHIQDTFHASDYGIVGYYVTGLPSYTAFGFGQLTPTYRIELPNVANAGGRGRANQWAIYSDNRTKNFLGELPQNKVLELYDLIKIQYYNPIENSQDENGFIQIGEIDFDKICIGIDAQDLYYTMISHGWNERLVSQIVYKPENENINYWSVDYDAIKLILIEGCRLKIEELEARIEKLEGR